MWQLVLLASLSFAAAQYTCGVGPRNIDYIVGGSNANPGDWPWQAALEYYNTDLSQWRHTCGAILIHPQYLLTAAHCVDRNPQPEYRIVLGQHDRGNKQGTEQILAVRSYDLHQNWDSSQIVNDIAIIRLALVADVSRDDVGVACLPETANQDYAGNMECWISGWGLLRGTDSDVPGVLQHVNLDVIANDDCQYRWSIGGVFPIANILASHICVTDVAGAASGACNGDSGGPLSCKRNGVYDVAGITSFGYQGCSTNYPSVYTRVSQFLPWIQARVPLHEVRRAEV